MKKYLAVGGLVITSIALGGYFFFLNPTASRQSQEQGTDQVTYHCDNGKYINAVFSDTGVAFTLSDGRMFSLLQAPVASGAKFLSRDGAVVLWTNDYSAFLTENDESTYTGCRVYPLSFPSSP